MKNESIVTFRVQKKGAKNCHIMEKVLFLNKLPVQQGKHIHLVYDYDDGR